MKHFAYRAKKNPQTFLRGRGQRERGGGGGGWASALIFIQGCGISLVRVSVVITVVFQGHYLIGNKCIFIHVYEYVQHVLYLCYLCVGVVGVCGWVRGCVGVAGCSVGVVF